MPSSPCSRTWWDRPARSSPTSPARTTAPSSWSGGTPGCRRLGALPQSPPKGQYRRSGRRQTPCRCGRTPMWCTTERTRSQSSRRSWWRIEPARSTRLVIQYILFLPNMQSSSHKQLQEYILYIVLRTLNILYNVHYSVQYAAICYKNVIAFLAYILAYYEANYPINVIQLRVRKGNQNPHTKTSCRTSSVLVHLKMTLWHCEESTFRGFDIQRVRHFEYSASEDATFPGSNFRGFDILSH